MKALKLLLIVIGILVLTAARLGAQDTLAAAKELYASAAYEEALNLLDRLKGGEAAKTDGPGIEQYRAFCLLALGRTAEAERAIETLVVAEPLYQPGESEFSPRVRAAFRDVRHRVLPSVVHQKYTMAKATYDRKEFAAAAAQFTRVLSLLGDSDLGEAAKDPAIADLRALAQGFLDLSAAAAAPAPPPPPPLPAPEPPPPEPARPRVFGSGDAGVTPPIIVNQEMPPWPALPAAMNAGTREHGVLEVVVDESGAVESAVMRQSLNRFYDAVLVNAAKKWRYQPARKDGKPVKYRKLIDVVFQRRDEPGPALHD